MPVIVGTVIMLVVVAVGFVLAAHPGVGDGLVLRNMEVEMSSGGYQL
jgi:hypothetical protein